MAHLEDLAKSGTAEASLIRKIDLARLPKHVAVIMDGNGHMVGTLLEVGRRRMSLGELRAVFKKRDRRFAGFTAPAHGLILLRVRY